VEGDGLLLTRAQTATITNLTINGFRGNGISVAGSSGNVTITKNIIGADPTGTFARPNNRGIGFANTAAFLGFSRVTDNVISGNLRTGIFDLRGDVRISGNRVGLQAHADQPLPNGGSGIYFDAGIFRVEATDNSIAFNGEMGVAIHPRAGYVMLSRNRIWHNGGLAIDDGLDGPSPSVQAPQYPSSEVTVHAPRIISAVFNAATKQTEIRIALDPQDTWFELFASDAPGDAQRPHPFFELKARIQDKPELIYDFVVKEDLRGQWITATASRRLFHPYYEFDQPVRTTELSNAVLVQ